MIPECVIHILQSLLRIFDPESLISHGGLLIVFLLVYASTGLFFFFYPCRCHFIYSRNIYCIWWTAVRYFYCLQSIDTCFYFGKSYRLLVRMENRAVIIQPQRFKILQKTTS